MGARQSGEQTGDYLFISSGYGKGCAVLRVVKGEGGAVGVGLVYENNRMRNHFASSVRVGDHFYGLDDNRLTFFHEGRFKQLSQTGGTVIKELLA